MKNLVCLLLMFFCLCPLALRAQQKHDKLRQIYLRLSDDSTKLDSALIYAFKVKAAAIKEYGSTSMQYYRSLNNIGYIYSEQGRYKKSRYWWLRCYNEIKSRDQSDYKLTVGHLYRNLKVTYLYFIPQADSATLFADKFIQAQLNQGADTTRAFLNEICELAKDFETTFGLPRAEKYYNVALSIREKMFGKRSREIVSGIDAILRQDSTNNNPDRRYNLYSVNDSAYSIAALDSLSRRELDRADKWDCIYYAAEMVDQSLKYQGETGEKFYIGLERLGLAYHYMLHEDSIAVFCLKKGLSILTEQHKQQSEPYVDFLSDLSSVYSDSKAYSKSIALGHQMVNLASEIGNKKTALYADALLGLGDLYSNTSYTDERSYRLANQYMQQGVAIYKEIDGETSEGYGRALQTLGGLCIRWARLDSAEHLFLQAYKLLAKINTPDKNYRLFRQIYMAYAYKDENAKSHQWLQKCIELKRQAGDTLGIAHLADLYNLASESIGLENWQKAAGTLSRLQHILDTSHKKTSAIYLDYLYLKADFESKQGNYQVADSILTYVLKIFTDSKHYFQDNYYNIRDIAEASRALADIYIQQKKYEEAKRANRLAISKMRSLGFDNSAAIVSSKYRQQAQIMDYLQQPDSAAYYYNVALTGLENGKWQKSIGYQEAKIDLATLLWKTGKYQQADQLMAEACRQLRETMINNMAGYSEKEKQQYNSIMQQSFYKYFSLQRAIHNQQPQTTTTAYNFLLQSKGLLLQTSGFLTKAIAVSADTVLQNRYARLKNIRQQLAKAYTQQEGQPGETTVSVSKLEVEAEKAEQLLSFNSPAFAQYHRQNNTTFAEVKKSLKPDEAAVEFVAFPYFNQGQFTDSVVYGAFVITDQAQHPVYVALKNAGKLADLVKGQGVSGRGVGVITTNKQVHSHQLLYQQIWQPLAPHVQAAKKIYLATDGLLNNVSFASLQDTGRQFLIDKYELHFILSTKDIARAKTQQVNTKKPAVALFGGANYSLHNENTVQDNLMASRSLPAGMRGGTAWNYLPNTLTEVNNIGAILKKKRWQVTDYTGKSASEANFKQLNGARAPTILHIATHGFYFPPGQKSSFSQKENPLLRTGLVFSAANEAWLGKGVATGQEDGILTAFEFANMDLQKTELVVLSACETGVGDVLNGEGVFGLQRAIRQAGIGKMIVSLWPVPDKETAEMMQQFYSAVAKGKNIVSAFRQAQSVMRTRHAAEPVLWAGFVLIE